MTTSLKNIVDSYFNSWKAHDFDAIRSLLADDVTFIGVLGEAHGPDEYINGLRGLTQIITHIDIKHRWVDESDIITWYELHTTKASTPLVVVNWMHIENGMIKKAHVTFDPRPLL